MLNCIVIFKHSFSGSDSIGSDFPNGRNHVGIYTNVPCVLANHDVGDKWTAIIDGIDVGIYTHANTIIRGK